VQNVVFLHGKCGEFVVIGVAGGVAEIEAEDAPGFGDLFSGCSWDECGSVRRFSG
jgi:hypothetical protein